MSHSPPGIRIANPDEERDRDKEVPAVTVVDRGEHVLSMLELDLTSQDPHFKYRWVNVAPIKVARARGKGYKFVEPDEDLIRTLVGESPDAEDGRIRVADVVLMKCPKPVHRERRVAVAKRTKDRLTAPKRKFKREATARGIERYNTPVEVITNKEPSGSKD